VIAYVAAVIAALPWLLVPLITIRRASRSRSLDEEPSDPPQPAPLVSVIVPARDERRNIERCVGSILSTTYPAVEVIVVDDHSTDGTGDLARRMASADPRLRVIENPPLPDDWFGKQWACATGAAVARGEILCFTDADTTHAPDLLTRAVNVMRGRQADLVSVAGEQEMETFWERVIQPQVFLLLTMRYGSTEQVSNARRAEDVIANGQFLMMARGAYESIGGHGAVRNKAAEDLAMAQRFVQMGKRIALVLGPHQLRTRMYQSLAELVQGWRKNVFAAGRDAAPRMTRAVYPVALLLAPLVGIVPLAVLLLCVFGILGGPWLAWSLVCVPATLLWWIVLYGYTTQPRRYALAFPLGALVLLYIVIGAILRGNRVSWKGRTYRAS